MIYVDVSKHWRKIGPLARSEYARQIWLPDMTEYWALRKLNCLKHLGHLGLLEPDSKDSPHNFESCDWRLGQRPLGFWEYVCHGACHWLVNLNLFLASASMPEHPWRIVSSNLHSTVWDGGSLLFDMNSLALEVPVQTAWKDAAKQEDSEVYLPGNNYEVGIWSDVVEDFKQGRLSKSKALKVLHESSNLGPQSTRRP